MIRLAVREDTKEIFDLAHEVHAENGIMDYDDDLFAAVMEKHFERTGAIICVIGEIGQRLEGIFVLNMGHPWYARSWLLDELFIFVRPEYRSKGHEDALIERAKRFSDEIGIPLVVGIFSSRRLEAKARLYRRKFGYPAGAIFTHNTPFNSDRSEKFGDWILRKDDAMPDLYSPSLHREDALG